MNDYIGRRVRIYTWERIFFIGVLEVVGLNYIGIRDQETAELLEFPTFGIYYIWIDNGGGEKEDKNCCNCSSPALKDVPCGIGPGAKAYKFCTSCRKEYVA